MPSGLIALVAVLIASGWFVMATQASRRSKIMVSILCLGSLAIGFFLPQWALGGLLLQVFLVIGITLYARAHQ
jgi:hypothetical protein